MLSPNPDLQGSLYFRWGSIAIYNLLISSSSTLEDQAVGPVFPLRILRLRELIWHIQGHTASMWQIWQWASPLEGQNYGCWAEHQGGWHLGQSTHHRVLFLKRPWFWEKLKAGGEGDNRGWDGWTASPTQWTTPGVGDGQGVLAYCSPWGRKESDTAEWLKWTELITEENWNLRRGVGQKPGPIWCEYKTAWGGVPPRTHSTPAYSTWLTQDEGLRSMVKPAGESEDVNRCLALVQVWGTLCCRWGKESGCSGLPIICTQVCWIPGVLDSLSSPGGRCQSFI